MQNLNHSLPHRILENVLKGVSNTEERFIRQIFRASPAIQLLLSSKPCPSAYNAFLQNIGAVSWIVALKVYNQIFYEKRDISRFGHTCKPNAQTSRVALNLLLKSDDWKLAIKHLIKYGFPNLSSEEGTLYGGRVHHYLREKKASEIAIKLLQYMKDRNLPFTADFRKSLFRNDLLSWSAHLRIFSLLYQKDRKLITSDNVHRMISLCQRSQQWRSCIKLLVLSQDLQLNIPDSILLKSALLFFKGDRWQISSLILQKYLAGTTSIQSGEKELPENIAERSNRAHMFALARMWQHALKFVEKEPIEKITHVLRLGRAWECAMRFCNELVCMKSCNYLTQNGRIRDIPWKIIENIVLAGKYDEGSRESSVKLLSPFCNSPCVPEGFWKLSLCVHCVNYPEIIRRLPIESQFLDIQFFPVIHRIHPCQRFKVLFPLILKYFVQTGVITPEEHGQFLSRFYIRFEHMCGGFRHEATSARWVFAFDILRLLTERQEHAPVQRPTFNQVMVAVSHVTSVPYLTGIKGHIEKIRLQRAGKPYNTESILRSFVFGGHIQYACDFMRRLSEWNLTIDAELCIFTISTMVLPGLNSDEGWICYRDVDNACRKGRSLPFEIPTRVRNTDDLKIVTDFLRMYEFVDLIYLDKKKNNLQIECDRFPLVLMLTLVPASIEQLQKRQPCQHPDVHVLYESSECAVVTKPPNLETIAHDAASSMLTYCPDLTSAILANFPTTKDVRSYGVTHRLDYQTSGLILIAKSQCSFHHVVHQSLTKRKKKSYLCLCVQLDPCRVIPKEGSISTQYADIRDRTHRMSLDGEAEAQTHYSIHIKFSSMLCLVECRLITGRQHQIRVHLKELGLLLLGDDRYGCGTSSTPLLQRVALHSKEIGFWDPSESHYCMIESTLPEDLVRALDFIESAHCDYP